MLIKIVLQLLKYFGVGFFLMMLYAAIMGKDNLIEYQLGSKLLIEEYCVIVALWIFIDLTKYLYATLFNTQTRNRH